MNTISVSQHLSLFRRDDSDNPITPAAAAAIAFGICADLILTAYVIWLYIRHRRRKAAIERAKERMTQRRRASRWLSGLVLLGRSPSTLSSLSRQSRQSVQSGLGSPRTPCTARFSRQQVHEGEQERGFEKEKEKEQERSAKGRSTRFELEA